MKKIDIKQIEIQIKDYIIITIAMLVVAVQIHVFMVPNKFVTGGISGLAIVIEGLIVNVPDTYDHLTNWISIGNIMIVLNIFLFILGLIFIGFQFGIRTIYSSFVLSFLVSFLEKVYPIKAPLMDDLFIQLIIGSFMSALGLSIAFKYKASTGGTDITGKIINKYFHIDLGKAVLLSDLVIALTALTIGFSAFVYGVFGIFLNGIMIDYLLKKFQESKEVVIISDHCDKIKAFIIFTLEKGATIYEARGAYTNEQKEIIRTVVNKKELYKLKEYIRSVDENAFITINDIHTIGLGFVGITD